MIDTFLTAAEGEYPENVVYEYIRGCFKRIV